MSSDNRIQKLEGWSIWKCLMTKKLNSNRMIGLHGLKGVSDAMKWNKIKDLWRRHLILILENKVIGSVGQKVSREWFKCSIICIIFTHSFESLQGNMGQFVSSHYKKAQVGSSKALHITNNDMKNAMNTSHKLLVCLVCDCFIMGGYSNIPSMTMSNIKKHHYHLGEEHYKEFYGKPLHKDIIEQCHVPKFPGMLMSKCSRNIGYG